MPLYEYVCKKCKITQELQLKIAEIQQKQYCQQCETAMERKYSNIRTGLIFGKGFFKTGGY